MACALSGAATFGPTAAIESSRMTTVPLSIVSPGATMIWAFVRANGPW
jgi:hypothetical protein